MDLNQFKKVPLSLLESEMAKTLKIADDQTVSGLSNFIGGLQVNGIDVASVDYIHPNVVTLDDTQTIVGVKDFTAIPTINGVDVATNDDITAVNARVDTNEANINAIETNINDNYLDETSVLNLFGKAAKEFESIAILGAETELETGTSVIIPSMDNQGLFVITDDQRRSNSIPLPASGKFATPFDSNETIYLKATEDELKATSMRINKVTLVASTKRIYMTSNTPTAGSLTLKNGVYANPINIASGQVIYNTTDDMTASTTLSIGMTVEVTDNQTRYRITSFDGGSNPNLAITGSVGPTGETLYAEAMILSEQELEDEISNNKSEIETLKINMSTANTKIETAEQDIVNNATTIGVNSSDISDIQNELNTDVAHLAGSNDFDTVPTVNGDNVMLAKDLPTNLATIDTAQTITGDKDHTGALTVNGTAVATTTEVQDAIDNSGLDTQIVNSSKSISRHSTRTYVELQHTSDITLSLDAFNEGDEITFVSHNELASGVSYTASAGFKSPKGDLGSSINSLEGEYSMKLVLVNGKFNASFS